MNLFLLNSFSKFSIVFRIDSHAGTSLNFTKIASFCEASAGKSFEIINILPIQSHMMRIKVDSYG